MHPASVRRPPGEADVLRASEFAYPYRHAQALGVLRLHLAPTLGGAPAAGVWWPHGRDLTREGPHLVDDFPKRRGRIDRLVYSPGDWDVVAEEVFTRHGRIKVGFLPARRTGGLVLLRLLGSEIIRLRVVWVAPRTDPGEDRPSSRA
ncbi:DUF5994 family protein [Nocardioides guangzhouensis]|uniref:DUF5994 family protein n=1 Tax=Nocardioides guangzhouensis TaxID=2497878 RepID=UPI003CCC6444